MTAAGPADDQAEALAYLSRTAELAGELAAGTRVLVRMDTARAAYTALTRYMAQAERDELGRMLARDTATRKARAAVEGAA